MAWVLDVFIGFFLISEGEQMRMRKWVRIVGLACLALTRSIQAGNFEVVGLVIDVPANFEGPVVSQPAAHSKTYAFTVASVVLSPSTVLQITSVDLGADLGKHKNAELTEITSRYLLQMLSGIESRRTEYQRSKPGSIRLGGVSGAEITWSGKLSGLETNGAMYCVAVGTGLAFFHVSGGGRVPNPDMKAAIKAVEALHLAP
jgi:hypothetical protein